MKEIVGNPLHLTSLNHVSLICRSVEESIDFYQNVLGFVPIIRPRSFDFDGAWLFGFGIGIHLLQSEDPEKLPKKTEINPKDNHISFQCESMGAVEKKLKEMEIKYKRANGFMIEISDCDNLPVVPLVGEMARTCSRVNLQLLQQQQQQQLRVAQQ
ncbi:hypothetical protein Dsin_013394 [Dipteronia sinensis]|uniref:VOC domain-containing protein n=1 Tax=Dipteronia sinensis TaxID=43782 RepID=A0AAE0AL48_9ROSI|nr:hypothetical protein Dsin_013394 [Dipteronia sinensis]